MPHPIEPSTIRILKPTGETVGTGFLVSRNLAVTCAHVIKVLTASAGGTIDIRFTGKSASTTALVLSEYWRPDEATDIAILQVDEVPAGVFPLRMGRASESRLKNDLYTFGYAIAADEQGIGGLGTFITLKQEGNFIQFRMHEANHGHSGAPIYDDKRGVVVGMIKKGTENLGRNAETTFAIPSETIWQVCPQLKPPTPILPHRNPIVEGINLLPYDYDVRIQNFLTEYLGTDSHPVPFGGRDDALKMLDTWLAETTPYLLLAAPAGRGKSALLVRWLDSLSAREDLALAFVPVSIRFGTNMERVFYAALAARLAFLHGDDIPASPETSTAVYRGLVSNYLSKPLANGRMLLLVLDGLDEAADWQAGADFMPNELPAGARVVVSARFLAGDADSAAWLRRLNLESNGLASAPSLTPLDHDGVRDVLFKMGCPLDELSRQVDIVAELYRLSEGDPLLVGLYVGDLWEKGDEVARLKPKNLAGIEPGYKGYFDRWWDDQKNLWGKDKPWLEEHIWTVLNLLAGALGPLFKDDMQVLAPELKSNYIADALDVLRRFIIGDNQTQGYTFSHPKLGQYFWEALTPTEQTQVEGHFLAWCERTFQEFLDGKRDPKKKAEVLVYVVRNYGAHLIRAKQPIEKWLPLIHHQQWAQAWFTVEGAYGGYSQDVQRVWEECRLIDRQAVKNISKAPYLGQQIRCGLIEASLHSMAGNIPAELIPVLVQEKIWTLPQAWMFIHQIPKAYQQADAISALLPHLASDQLFDALTAARLIQDESFRASVLSALAQWLPEIAEEALVATRVIQNEWQRAEVLSALAQRLPESDLGQILAAARAFQNEVYSARVLSALVQHLPEDDLGQILEAARTFQTEVDSTSVLSALAQRLPEIVGDALAAARAIRYEESRAEVLSTLVQFLPEGDLGQVLAAARTFQNKVYRAEVLSTLVERQSEIAGEALAAAQEIQDESPRAEVLSALAQRLPEGKLGQVLAAAQEIQNEWQRARVLSALAQRLPGLPEIVGEALTAARAIQDESPRAEVLSALAQRLPEIAGEALAAARAIQDKVSRTRVLSALAQRLPEIAGEALTAARAIQDEEARAEVLSALAQRLPEIAGEALTAARAIQNEWQRARVLSALAQRLPEIVGEVLTAARAIQDEEARAEVLSALAQRLPEIAEEALATARAIQDEDALARVLSALAQRLPEGNLGQVLAAVRAIWYEEARAWVLSTLAQRLPEGDLGQVLAAAQAIRNERPRTEVLSALAQRSLDGDFGQALTMARAIQDEWQRAHVLSALAQRVPEDNLGQIMAAALVFQNETQRAHVLSALAQRLPEGDLGQILAAARAIWYGESRAEVLSALAQRLPEIAGEALTAARAIQDKVSRARVLSALAQPLIALPSHQFYPSLEPVLGVSSQQERADAFYDISALLPIFIHLSADDVDKEIYEAVRDVTTWWP